MNKNQTNQKPQPSSHFGSHLFVQTFISSPAFKLQATLSCFMFMKCQVCH